MSEATPNESNENVAGYDTPNTPNPAAYGAEQIQALSDVEHVRQRDDACRKRDGFPC